MNIYAFNGGKGSGKTYVADKLEDFLELSGLDVHRFAYADPIKDMCAVLLRYLGHSDKYVRNPDFKETVIPGLGVTGRKMMQTLGTEWGRNMIHPQLWLKTMDARINALHHDARVIIDDCRFANEVEHVHSYSPMTTVVLMEVKREGKERGADTHISEQELPYDLPVLQNTNGISGKDILHSLVSLKDLKRRK